MADDEEIYELCQQVKENYNYKRKDNKEEVQEEDERNVILKAIEREMLIKY